MFIQWLKAALAWLRDNGPAPTDEEVERLEKRGAVW